MNLRLDLANQRGQRRTQGATTELTYSQKRRGVQ
jgi:hypothetical protein